MSMAAAVASALFRPPANGGAARAGRSAAARHHAVTSNRVLVVLYLVDTNVISAAALSRSASPALIAWMDEHSTQLYMSAVTIAEIEDGIAKVRREDATRKAADLDGWLETLRHLYGQRIFAFDTATARHAGALSDRARTRTSAGFRRHHHRRDRPPARIDDPVAESEAFRAARRARARSFRGAAADIFRAEME